MAAVHRVAASKLVHSIELKITGLGVMRARWAIASLAFRLGGWISGATVVIEAAQEAGGSKSPQGL